MFFAVLYHAAPGGQEHRADVRPLHRGYLDPIVREGRVAFAGPFIDGSGDGLILLEAPSLGDAWNFVSGDPYVREGIVNVVEVRPVEKVYPS
ncbi:MAG: YciI family protein [Candidatus Binatia bacterium]